MTSYKLRRSSRSGKKWQVTTPSGKTVHFGSAGMSDYTKHKDPERKERYIKRHAGNKDGKTSRRENWTKSGLDTAGFWSRWLTWNKPTLQASIKDIENRFNISIDYNQSKSPRSALKLGKAPYRTKSPRRSPNFIRRRVSPKIASRYRSSTGAKKPICIRH
jgi:hypothetical protein